MQNVARCNSAENNKSILFSTYAKLKSSICWFHL